VSFQILPERCRPAFGYTRDKEIGFFRHFFSLESTASRGAVKYAQPIGATYVRVGLVNLKKRLPNGSLNDKSFVLYDALARTPTAGANGEF
jgi:hypothetical protein